MFRSQDHLQLAMLFLAKVTSLKTPCYYKEINQCVFLKK